LNKGKSLEKERENVAFSNKKYLDKELRIHSMMGGVFFVKSTHLDSKNC